MMSDFALLITWTCYGQWLPGDKRGYVSNTRNKAGGFEPKENIAGTPYTTDDRDSRELAKSLQKHETVRLTVDQARCVAESLVAAATERGWIIVQGAVMANHVHLVVRDCPDDGPTVRRVFKGVSQARLSSIEGHPRRWWTHGGSDRYLHGAPPIEAAALYVADQKFLLVRIENNVVLPCT